MEETQKEKLLVVSMTVRNFCHDQGFQCSVSAIPKLSHLVEGILTVAMYRAKANGRKTVREEDI